MYVENMHSPQGPYKAYQNQPASQLASTYLRQTKNPSKPPNYLAIEGINLSGSVMKSRLSQL